jgi:tRNA nucleotidyltransferase (CCA-adding enzyme)
MDVITTHKGTDFDALACVVAATLIFPDATACLPETLNPNVRSFISLHKDQFAFIRTRDVDIQHVHRLIVVDANRWHRLELSDALREKKSLEIYLFDHHGEDGDIEPSWKCQRRVGAAITLMLHELKTQAKTITPIHASLFLAGLYEDTGNLTFYSTTAEDAYAAAYLLEMGADMKILSAFIKPAYSRKQKDLFFRLLETAKRTKLNGSRVAIIPAKVDGHIDNLAMVIQMVLQILNLDAAFGLFSISGKRCLVIGRSVTDSINIGTIMRCIGGGGHSGAGSAMTKSINPGVLAAWIRILISGKGNTTDHVGQLMSAPVFTVSPETTMEAAVTAFRNRAFHGAPVVEKGQIVGMLSLRDLRKLKRKSQYQLPVKAFMSTPVHHIEPWKNPAAAAHLMVRFDIGRLPVMDNGKLVGIISRSDAMNHFYGLCPLRGSLT